MKMRYVGMLLIGAAALGAAGMTGISAPKGLIVHEWGTFTSLQGSDGVPLRWNPLESSRLPRFVYNWNSAGLGRRPAGLLALGQKNALVTLQRMETPVIYFYANQKQTVDVTVRFPQGGITEWYPQAPQIGPCLTLPSPIVTRLDSSLHRAGVSPNFSLDAILKNGGIKDSLIHWHGLRIVPAAQHPELDQLLPRADSGNHYFTARDTDSAYVEADPCTNAPWQCEKFLFYRGVGNFTAPLGVQMNAAGMITVANVGEEPLAHLVILSVHAGGGKCLSVERLDPGQQKAFNLGAGEPTLPLEKLRNRVRDAMLSGLKAEGLYAREATAMVNTWDDSWFQEDGVRVLYLLPRAWTDRTLPMQIDPQPKQLVRVMVGRAEIVTPDTERRLAVDITQVGEGRGEAGQEIREIVSRLGRFGQPVLRRALAGANAKPDEQEKVLALLWRAPQ